MQTEAILFPSIDIERTPEHEKVFPIRENYSFLKERSGLFFLYYKRRCIYIGCASDLYNGIYAKTTIGNSACSHFLLEHVEAFSFIELSSYDNALAKKLRDSLITTQRPYVNILFKEYQWLHKDLTERLHEAHREINRMKNKQFSREAYEALQAKYNALLETLRSLTEETK